MLGPVTMSKRYTYSPLTFVHQELTHPRYDNVVSCNQNRTDASKHYQEKVEYVRKNLETLQETIQRKQDNIQLVGQIMQAKIHQASQAGAARASKS